MKVEKSRVRYLLDVMKISYMDICSMPYKFYDELVDWKVELESDKHKKMEEKMREYSKKKEEERNRRKREANTIRKKRAKLR